MSEATEAEIERAQAAVRAARTKVGALKRSVLENIAANMPEKVEAIAKRSAHKQPDVTRELGKERIDEMRADLAAEAKRLGDEFIGAIDEIDWPRAESSYSRVEARHIHSALFAKFRGRVSGPTDILARYGYFKTNAYHRDIPQTLPQELYTESDFNELAAALTELGREESGLDDARAADHKAAVNELWGD
ncbi:hypothetical protein [Microbacterium sp. 2FI]|uniref:hypothetical protein n=1 Tax=Microbacterium sp. 2FI TaxID=2502193 RepID=UPI0010FA3194|nr:hypothetical protein [Microbacterium sp. 2FI]